MADAGVVHVWDACKQAKWGGGREESGWRHMMMGGQRRALRGFHGDDFTWSWWWLMVVGFRSAQRFAMMASLFPPSLLDSLLFLSHYYYLWWPLLSHPLTLRSFSFYPLFFWSLQNPNNIKLVSSSHNKAGDVIENRWWFLDSYSVRWTVVHWETSFLFSHPFLMALRCFSRKVQMLCFCNQRCACGNSMFSFYAGWEHEKLSKYRRGFSWCEVDLGKSMIMLV